MASNLVREPCRLHRSSEPVLTGPARQDASTWKPFPVPASRRPEVPVLPVWRRINLSASHSPFPHARYSLARRVFAVALLSLAATCFLHAQTDTPGTGNQDTTAQDQAGSQTGGQAGGQAGTGTRRPTAIAASQSAKLALAPIATYDNKYEVFGGINLENFQAGQNLPKRMNFAGAEAQGTYWLRSRLGATADYRFEGGTTPVFPNRYYNRVVVLQQNFLGGVTYRGPKGRYGAIDYHAFAGGSHGTFDYAINHYPGGSPISATGIGLYSNRTAFMAALGGSADFNYTKNIAIRLQPDLILEHYGTELREFVAISGGIVYRFGKR